MNIAALLKQATAQLQPISDSPRLDAEVLLGCVLEQPRSYLFSWPEREPDAAQQQAFQQLIEQRASGVPVAHLTGEREFWSLPLKVSADTLIPRPDTELLVAWVLEHFPADKPLRLVDLGTGSGAIALAIASERPKWQILGVEISRPALAIAEHNRDRLKLHNVQLIQGRWCDAFSAQDRFQIIVSNPPYIASDDPHLQQGDVRFEPESALVAGADGLDDIRHIATCTREHLDDGGWLLLEHGFDQADAVAAILRQSGFQQVGNHRDLAGQMRATSGCWRPRKTP